MRNDHDWKMSFHFWEANLEVIGQKEVTFGKYKGSTYDDVRKDRSYCTWLIQERNTTGSPTLQDLAIWVQKSDNMEIEMNRYEMSHIPEDFLLIASDAEEEIPPKENEWMTDQSWDGLDQKEDWE